MLVNQHFFQKIQDYRDKNLILKKILEEYERAQKIYEKTLEAVTVAKKMKPKGTYSDYLKRKDYYAHISTTTQRSW